MKGKMQMNTSIEKPSVKHANAVAKICTLGWKQTVEGRLSEEYQYKNIVYWYNKERVSSHIKSGNIPV